MNAQKMYALINAAIYLMRNLKSLKLEETDMA